MRRAHPGREQHRGDAEHRAGKRVDADLPGTCGDPRKTQRLRIAADRTRIDADPAAIHQHMIQPVGEPCDNQRSRHAEHRAVVEDRYCRADPRDALAAAQQQCDALRHTHRAERNDERWQPEPCNQRTIEEAKQRACANCRHDAKPRMRPSLHHAAERDARRRGHRAGRHVDAFSQDDEGHRQRNQQQNRRLRADIDEVRYIHELAIECREPHEHCRHHPRDARHAGRYGHPAVRRVHHLYVTHHASPRREGFLPITDPGPGDRPRCPRASHTRGRTHARSPATRN